MARATGPWDLLQTQGSAAGREGDPRTAGQVCPGDSSSMGVSVNGGVLLGAPYMRDSFSGGVLIGCL